MGLLPRDECQDSEDYWLGDSVCKCGSDSITDAQERVLNKERGVRVEKECRKSVGRVEKKSNGTGNRSENGMIVGREIIMLQSKSIACNQSNVHSRSFALNTIIPLCHNCALCKTISFYNTPTLY